MSGILPPPDLTEYHWFDTCQGCPQCDFPIPYVLDANASPSTVSLAGTSTEKQAVPSETVPATSVAGAPTGVL